MISLESKFIFIHIPRTAGTSIEYCLNEFSSDESYSNIVKPSDPKKLQGFISTVNTEDWFFGSTANRSMGPYYQGYKHWSYNQYKDYLDYLQVDHDKFYKFTMVRHPIDKLLSVSRFNGVPHDILIERMTDFREEWLHFQSRYVIGSDDINIFKYENLQSDWKLNCSLMNINYTELPYRGRKISDEGAPPRFFDVLDTDTIKYYEDFFKEDMEKFGYDPIT